VWRSGSEEAVCQAHGYKKQVFKPMRNSLQVRECVEEVSSPGGSAVVAIEL
jgi:hypothetical protein